jgi:hypothetical protein
MTGRTTRPVDNADGISLFMHRVTFFYFRQSGSPNILTTPEKGVYQTQMF